jgi:protein TonB
MYLKKQFRRVCMNFSEHGHEPSKKLVGITVVVMIHVVLIYALINGLGKQIISVIKELPIQAVLIEAVNEEVKPPAPPTPVAPPSPPKKVIPSKPVVPLPEVPVQQAPSPNAIQAVTNELPSEKQTQETVTAEPAKGSSVTHAIVDFTTCSKPDYPRNSLRNEEQGTVRIQFLIGLDGHVADSKIEKSSGFRTLDAAAKKALSLCKFKPGTVDGKPQQSWTSVNYVWKLPD